MLTKCKTKTFSDLKVLTHLTFQAPFFRKLLEVLLCQSKGANKRKKRKQGLQYQGAGTQECVRRTGWGQCDSRVL
jgi:hypothetical protein